MAVLKALFFNYTIKIQYASTTEAYLYWPFVLVFLTCSSPYFRAFLSIHTPCFHPRACVLQGKASISFMNVYCFLAQYSQCRKSIKAERASCAKVDDVFVDQAFDGVNTRIFQT